MSHLHMLVEGKVKAGIIEVCCSNRLLTVNQERLNNCRLDRTRRKRLRSIKEEKNKNSDD
jgi:hypothetical protein